MICSTCTDLVNSAALEHNREDFERGEYDEDVEEEVTRAIEDTDNESAVRVMQLTKKYRHYLCLPSQRDVTAVDNLSFTMEEGGIFRLLGHNGAGKVRNIISIFGNTNSASRPPSSTC